MSQRKVWTHEEIEEHFKQREETKDKLISFHITNEERLRRKKQAESLPRDERGRWISGSQ